jgi:hypothetical protein
VLGGWRERHHQTIPRTTSAAARMPATIQPQGVLLCWFCDADAFFAPAATAAPAAPGCWTFVVEVAVDVAAVVAGAVVTTVCVWVTVVVGGAVCAGAVTVATVAVVGGLAGLVLVGTVGVGVDVVGVVTVGVVTVGVGFVTVGLVTVGFVTVGAVIVFPPTVAVPPPQPARTAVMAATATSVAAFRFVT